MNKQRCIETSEDLVRAFADFFDEIAPRTPEEIDVALREAGYDPNEVGARMKTAAERALADSPLNWRNRAQREIEAARSQIAGSATAVLRSREEIIAAIEQLVAQSGSQMAYAHRNLESETDEDLVSLLSQLEYLTSKKCGESEE